MRLSILNSTRTQPNQYVYLFCCEVSMNMKDEREKKPTDG